MDIQNIAADADEFTSNAFLIDETALIDAGADDVVLEQLDGVDLDTIVITHSHWDHVENLPEIVDRQDNVAVYAFEPANVPVDAEPIHDEAEITVAGHTFVAYHTPGHRDDHLCLYNADKQVLFSGDLIFPDGAFGRTDLDQGDRDTLIESIDRITALDVRALYPGHDDPTTENVNDQIMESLNEAKKHEPKY